ncbi:27 kDa hemolymph protein-like, partial [Ostrinia furnacalis]|uniref:27 kDa hemolymph protein-like n=1 Tax=Ostrinia furnacalis TaxID=93504 RepID=UPI00103FA857
SVASGTLAEYQISDDEREKVKEAIAAQCKKNGAEDKADDVQKAGKTFLECLKAQIDPATIQKEIEEAKPKGALDEVFGKYCARSPQLKSCFNALIDSVSPCLDSEVRNQAEAVKNGTAQLLDFVCHKDGDRIALFIAEKGPECFKDQAAKLRQCGEPIQKSFSSIEDIKKLSLVEKCQKFDEVSTCLVNALEECPNPTPGNMAESLIKYVRKGSPCNTALPKN